jgi:hypothetical protein
MTPSRNCTAIKASVSLALLFLATAASAAPVGTVTELDGNLLVSRANGSVKVLGVGSAIEEGDILASRKATYVTLSLADRSSVTLGPDTNVKVERFAFTEDAPVNDGALLALAKGSVRITAGLLGTRSGDTFTLATPTATLVVTGANVIAEYVVPDQAPLTWRGPGARDSRQRNMVPVSYSPGADSGFVRTASHSNTLRLAQLPPVLPRPPTGGLAPGLYVSVIDGAIMMSNRGGTTSFTAGQFGYTANVQVPPMVVPANPGLKFTPPPTFASSPGQQGASGGGKSNAVDCEVR